MTPKKESSRIKSYFCRKKMNRKITLAACFFGLTAIILGAFGAHALKKVLTIEQLATFEVGVRYQMYHALFLFFVTVSVISAKAKKNIFLLTSLGILLFSGSIYLLSTTQITQISVQKIGFLTPIGGLFFIVAWFVLAFQFLKKP